MDPKTQVVEVVSRKLPLNRLGLPDGIFRADLLPIPQALLAPSSSKALPVVHEQGSSVELATLVASTPEAVAAGSEGAPSEAAPWDSPVTQPQFDPAAEMKRRDDAILSLLRNADIHVAYVPIRYDEGFPTLPNQRPIWEIFEWEDAAIYRAFQLYLRMKKKSARSLFVLSELLEAHEDFQGLKPPTLTELRDAYVQYYWKWRSLAYDMFFAAVRRRERAFAVMALEDKHTKQANKLFKQLQIYMNGENNDGESEFWQTMTPQVAVNLLGKLVEWQRINLGLPGKGASPNADSAPEIAAGGAMSLEVILQQIAGAAGSEASIAGQTIDQSGAAVADEFRREVLSDPKATAAAQALIIKLTSVKTGGKMQHGVDL